MGWAGRTAPRIERDLSSISQWARELIPEGTLYSLRMSGHMSHTQMAEFNVFNFKRTVKNLEGLFSAK